MGIKVDCPHCGQTGHAPHSQAGKKAKCASCNGIMRIPIPEAKLASSSSTAAPSRPPAPPRPAASPKVDFTPREPSVSSKLRRKRQSSLIPIVNALVGLTITASTLVAGYIILDRNGAWDKKKQPVRVTVENPSTRQRPRLRVTTPKEPQLAKPIATPTEEPSKTEIAEPEKPTLPKHINLHASTNTAVKKLFDAPLATSIALQSIDNRLTLDDKSLIWKEGDEVLTVAGLDLKDGKVVFRWLTSVPDDAAAAVHNSVLHVDNDGVRSTVALRSPVVALMAEFTFDKKMLRVSCKCPDSPHPREIKLAITPSPGFPGHRVDGDLSCLNLNGEATIWYTAQGGVATRVRLRKTGTLASGEFESRYRLPSGEEGPLTVKHGKGKRIELTKLLKKATNARNSISGLKNRLAALQRERSAWQSKDMRLLINGNRLNNPAGEAKKAVEITLRNNSIRRVQALIAEAERLIKMHPEIERELAALDAISRFVADVEEKHSFAYRFFMTIDDHEVTLVTAE